MKIYIIRHGQTDWNVEGRYAGRMDIPLNRTGIKQAEEIREKLKDITFDKVYSSPLSRTYQTARIISDGEIVKDERIIERYNGELEGKLKSEIKDEINFNDPNQKKYNIESVTNVRERIKSFFDDITTNSSYKNILVVMHAGVGIYARCYFEGELQNNDYDSYTIRNCEIKEYEI